MTRRILTAFTLIPLALAAIFVFPLPLFLIFVDIILLLALREFKKLIPRNGTRQRPLVYPALLSMPWVWAYAPEQFTLFLVIAVFVLLASAIFVGRDLASTCPGIGTDLLSLLYLGFPLSMVIDYHPRSIGNAGHPERAYELLMLLLIVWGSDSAAYFVGRAFGSHKITPRISPNKSLEGFVAGLLVPVGIATAFQLTLLPDRPLWFMAMAGLFVGGGAILGDLFESALKRGAGIKDTSGLVPGHGGVLDRVDSLLFAVPTYYVLSALLQLGTPAQAAVPR